MNEYEKEIMRLLKAHEKIRKAELVDNINRAIKKKSVSPYGKNKWVCKVTGSPMGTVCTWFTKSKCRAENKIPLYAMCQIAAALHISVWNFLEIKETEQQESMEPDRRCKLYWYLRRNEAEKRWNGSHLPEEGEWREQSLKVQRDFLDELYWEKINNQKKEERKDE